MNYYNRHLGDYSRDTGHLSLLEHGVLTLLLDRYYGSEKGIEHDLRYRVCRANSRPEREAVDRVLSWFFVLQGDIWMNARAEKEIEAVTKRIDASRENGGKGGRAKAKNAILNSNFDAQECNLEYHQELNLEQFTDAKKPRKNKATTNPAGTQSVESRYSEKLAHQSPITNNQDPNTKSSFLGCEEIALTGQQQPLFAAEPQKAKKATKKAKAEPEKTELQKATAATWDAYSEAFKNRYGDYPDSNPRARTDIKNFCQMIKMEDAPAVAAFFVSHNDAWYAQNAHPTWCLSKHATKLRMEWATGTRITRTGAIQQEKSAHNWDLVQKMKQEAANSAGRVFDNEGNPDKSPDGYVSIFDCLER